MAGEWIKWVKGLERKREVVAMAIALRPTGTLALDCEIIAAKWMKVWSWADTETADGIVDGVSVAFVDGIAGIEGFFDAAEAVGWACLEGGGIAFSNYERHNGNAAKKRATEQAKKAAQRKKPHACPDSVPLSTGQERDQRREEKRRDKGISISTAAEPFESDTPAPLPQETPGFFLFLNAYPPYRRSRRYEAQALWREMAVEPKAEAVLAGLEAWKASDQWRDGKVERIDNFLKDSMWENLPPESANGPDSRNQPHRRPSSEDARRAADRAQRVGGGAKPAVRVY